MVKKLQAAKEVLKAAKSAPSKSPLNEHLETILTLRDKSYSWRDIAAFLTEHGVETDHSKIFRFVNKQRRNKMDPYENYFVPTSNQYLSALKDIEEKMTEQQKGMLGFHYNAHNRTASFGELASAVGYKSANIEYGKFGRALGEKLEMKFSPMDETGEDKPFFCSSIGAGSLYKKKGQDYQLIMHHELSKAITESGWFKN